jgi:putative DNA primase/helicase
MSDNPVLCKRCGKEPAELNGSGEISLKGMCVACFKKSIMCCSCGKPDLKLKKNRCAECTEELRKIQQELNEPTDKPQIADLSDRSQELSLGKRVDENGNESRLVVQRMDTVQAERLEWIWPGKLPRGMFAIISGRMGSGKGISWADWTARITTGQPWPDGAQNTMGPKMVLIAAPEDDPKRTLRPRLEAAGADLKKVLWLKRTESVETVRRKTAKAERQMLLERDLLNIAQALKHHSDIALVILDPLSSFFSIKMTDDREMRPVMDAITKMCSMTGTTLLAVSHTNKRSDVDSTQRVLGASCVAGSARIIWNFSPNPDDKEERLMSLVKSNVGSTAGQKFRVKVVDITLLDGTKAETARCEWLGDHNEDADEVTARGRDQRQQGDRQKDIAVAFIRMKLSDGMKPAKEMYKQAEKEGIAEKTLQRAKYSLGVRSVPSPKGEKSWYWTLNQAEDPVMEPEAMEAAM